MKYVIGCFVFGFVMLIFGIACSFENATVGIIGIVVGIVSLLVVIIPLVYFIRAKGTNLKLVKAKFDLKAILKACSNGSSEMLTNLSMSLVNMLYNAQLMKYIGSDGVAAYGIIMYISFIFSGTYLGYSIGTAPIIGYHYGAGNTEELKSLLKKSLRLILVTSINISKTISFNICKL